MKQGDIVKPLGSCGGAPGAARCSIAMVLGFKPLKKLAGDTVSIVCPCGVQEVYRSQLEVIDTDLAYSADPV